MRREETRPPEGQEKHPTLPEKPTATIQFDGLIMGAYDQAKRLYQAGVHVKAEGHHLVITVGREGEEQPFWPRNESDWDTTHSTIKALAPFWLFVDSGDGLNENDFNASLYNPHDSHDPRSFGKIFNFERQHNRELQLYPDKFAEFNFPHGTAYSADNTQAQLHQLEKNQVPSAATVVGDIDVSTLGAIDIADVSDDQTTRELVLVGDGGKREFFRLPLDAGTKYEIKMENRPIHHHRDADSAGHFIRYYDMFPLNAGEKQFLVQPPRPHGVETEDSPPCIGSSGSTTGGLGGGGNS